MKNPNPNRLSTIKLKQYIRDNYPNITPKRVYDYLMNTPSINQFKRKLMNTPNQKRDLFNAREEMERREREREREREYYYNNENNPYNPYTQDFYRRNSYKINDEYNINRGMNSYSDYPRKSFDYNNKENIVPNHHTQDYNMNNVNPYSFQYGNNKYKNMNSDYAFHQRNKLYNEPDSYTNEYGNYPPPHNYGPNSYYNDNDKDRYLYEKLRKTYNSYDNMKSSYPHHYSSMNSEFHKMNHGMEDDFIPMSRSKEHSQYELYDNIMPSSMEDTYKNSNNLSEGYNKSLKSYVKPIAVRAESEASYFESFINFIVKINNSWRLGKFLFGTSMDRYVSILIQDIQLQQWAIQSMY